MCNWNVVVIELSLVIVELIKNKWKFFVILFLFVGVNYIYIDDRYVFKMFYFF